MVTIRKYQEKDKDNVRKICADTCKKFLQKNEKMRRAGTMMFVDYYLDFEPENVFVAANENDEAVGYIVASTNKDLMREKMKKVYLPQIRRIRWYLGIFTRFMISTSYKMDTKFGAGFHINIDEKYQGQKLGPKLLTEMGKHLLNCGFKYMYLVTQNRKTRGYGFYMHFGFKEAAKCAAGSLCLTYDLEQLRDK